MADAIIKAEASPHYVDWPAILAGVAVSLGISTVFLAFGSVIGLSLTSFQSSPALPATGLVIAAALWFLWVQISSFIGGAYIAGRLRRKVGDATVEEAELRDGAHGLIVWAVNLAIGSLIAGFLALVGVSGTFAVATSVATSPGVSNVAAMDYYVDRLMRSGAAPGPTDQAAQPSATTATSTSPPAMNADERAQFGRILAQGIVGRAMDQNDSSYLVNQISARAQIPETDAQQRLSATTNELKAKAEHARRLGILVGFLTAASFIVSAAAAWWTARVAGKHRDEGVDHSRFVRWN
jgi:hypothetical protein